MRLVKKSIFSIAFVIAHVFILRNVFLLSKDMLTGDLSAEKMIPLPRYGFARIPDSPLTEKYHAQNRLAVDFAQIYFPAQNLASLGENYRNGFMDPLQRPSRYAPLVNLICSITICKLEYGIASLLHMLIQLLVFFLIMVYSFRSLKIEKEMLPGVMLANIYLFLTPAGLSWFERGQFSLYVGAAYLLIILGIMKGNLPLVLLSVIFAFIKWISIPYIFVVFTVTILGSKTLGDLKKNMIFANAFLLFLVCLTFLLPVPSIDFLKGLYSQERFAVPGGISLAKVLPVWMDKIVPIPLILLGYIQVKINRNVFTRLIPFLAGSAILMLTFPTLAYEYNLPSLIVFIPLIYFWMKSPDNLIPGTVRNVMKYSLFSFICLASFSNFINQGGVIMAEYFFIASILLIIPLFYQWKPNRDSNLPDKIHIQ
jgi:hypothetical protein